VPHGGVGALPQVAVAMTYGSAMPVASQALSRLMPSFARNAFCPVLAR